MKIDNLLSLCDPGSCCECRYFICQECLDCLGNVCPSACGKNSSADGTKSAPYWFAKEYCQQQGSILATIHSLEKVSKKWNLIVQDSLDETGHTVIHNPWLRRASETLSPIVREILETQTESWWCLTCLDWFPIMHCYQADFIINSIQPEFILRESWDFHKKKTGRQSSRGRLCWTEEIFNLEERLVFGHLQGKDKRNWNKRSSPLRTPKNGWLPGF